MHRPLAGLDRLPTLRTARTVLRPLTQADAEQLFEVFSDPQTMRYWSSPPHRNRDQTAAMIASIDRGFEQRTVMQWGIERGQDARLLGTVTPMPAGEQPRAELGFILGRAHWGSVTAARRSGR